MKKWILAAAAAVLALPFLLPDIKEITRNVEVPAPATAILRQIGQSGAMGQWWPGKQSPDSGWVFGNGTYHFAEAYIGSIALRARHGSLLTDISIGASGVASGRSVLSFQAVTSLASNPYSRLWQYFSYSRIQGELDLLIDSLAARFSNADNLYGYHIERQQVKDATLVSLKQAFDHIPSTEEIYSLITRIRAYIASKGARESNHPMLNIYSEDGGKHHTAQVAIPTDRELPTEGPFLLKRMLPNGNILMAETKGGRAKADSCMQALEYYVRDRNIMSPAIPFQSLVTDRIAEQDSTKWVTRVYYPVF